MDIKVFYKKNGGVIQLIEEEKIQNWSIELTFIFVEYIRNKLRSYRDDKVQNDISEYLDEILTLIAIPKLKKIFDNNNQNEIISILEKFEELSESNNKAANHISPFLPKLLNNSNKNIVKKVQNISQNLKS